MKNTLIFLLLSVCSVNTYGAENETYYKSVDRYVTQERSFCESYGVTATRQAWNMRAALEAKPSDPGVKESCNSTGWLTTELENKNFCEENPKSAVNQAAAFRSIILKECLNAYDRTTKIEPYYIDNHLIGVSPEDLGNSYIAEAIYKNDILEAKRYIAAGVSLNFEPYFGFGVSTRHAIVSGAYEVLKFLKPFNVTGTKCFSCTNNGGSDPLYMYLAAQRREGRLDKLTYRELSFVNYVLSAEGVSVISTGEFIGPHTLSVSTESIELLDTVLNHTNLEELNRPIEYVIYKEGGNEAIYEGTLVTKAVITAPYKHKFKVVKALLEKGANPNLFCTDSYPVGKGSPLSVTRSMLKELMKIDVKGESGEVVTLKRIEELLLNYGTMPTEACHH